MDTEKDNLIADNSPRKSEDRDPNQQPAQNPLDNSDNPPPSDDADIKQEEPTAEATPENDDRPPSSPAPPDFCKVSEEIDQYISSLSNTKVSDGSELPEVPVSVEQFAVLAEEHIARYDSIDNPPVKWSQLSDEEASSFLEAANRISKLYASFCEFSSESKYASPINRIGGVMQRAMFYLEEEFRSLLEDHKISDHVDQHHQNNDSSKSKQSDKEQCTLLESDSIDAEDNYPGYPEDVVSNLKKLANAMMLGGYEAECYQAYFISRRSALEQSLHKLGFENLSIDHVQKMQWESLEKEIAPWIGTFKRCHTEYFAREFQLSEAVFSENQSASKSLFISLVRSLMIQLFNFAEAVAMTKRSTEKLFKFLDIYETLRDPVPAIDGDFLVESVEELKSEASLTRGRLGEAMVCILCELENSIKADSGKTPVPGGAVHPVTRYIMNYLKYACEYRDTLEQVFREHQKIDRSYSTDNRSDYDPAAETKDLNNEAANQSPFELQIVKLMDLLDTNLEAKSKLYRDPSLSLIFMMNNGRYILQKIRESAEMNGLMGDSCVRKRSSDLRQYHKNYQRETWVKLLGCLNVEGLNVNGKVVKPVLKERFKSFNAMFDEIHKTQSTWVVADKQLQSELRVSISAVVIPAYRSFMARFSQTFTPGRQTEKYIKFQPEDIETHIDELFDGNAAPAAGRKRV